MKQAAGFGALAFVLAGAVSYFLLLDPGPAPEAQPVPTGELRDTPAPERTTAVQADLGVLAADTGDAARNAAILRNNEGVRLLNAGELDAALVELEAAHAALPEDVGVAKNLAEGLVRSGVRYHDAPERQLAEALACIERALLLDPERLDLLELQQRWARELELAEQFTTYVSQHFELAFDGERADILGDSQAAIDVLEEAYGDFWLLFQVDPTAERGARFRVVFYEPEQFREVTGLGHWAGGAFDGTLRLPIDDFDAERARWSRTLRHELAHAFLSTDTGTSLPGWFEEGLAQWVEGDLASDTAAARRTLSGAEPAALSELEAPLSTLGSAEQIQRAYAQGLLFTLFLIEQYGESTIGAMVAGARAGQSVEQSFEAQLGVPLGQAHADFADALNR